MDDVLRISMVRQQFEGVGMLPKCIDKLLNIILTTITESLVVCKWVRLLSLGLGKKRCDSRGGILGFFHSEKDSKRKDRINEAMGIAYAEESVSGEIRDTVGVVGNAAHLLDKLNLRKTSRQFRVQLVKLAQQELMFALIFRAVVIGGHNDANA